MSRAGNPVLIFIVVISLSVTAEASQVDFAWSTPEYISYKDGSEDEERHLVWLYSIKNTTDKKIIVPVSTFLKTDTEKDYEDKYIPDIAVIVSREDEKYISADEMKGEFEPGVTKKGIAVFEDIDPNAKRIDIFVTGLSHFFFWRWRLVDYSYKITYKKSGDKWILEEHGFSKDNSHRDYADKFK